MSLFLKDGNSEVSFSFLKMLVYRFTFYPSCAVKVYSPKPNGSNFDYRNPLSVSFSILA